MAKKTTWIIIGLAIAALAIFVVGPYITGNVIGSSGKYDEFAQCLSDNGATMYGTYWCAHCQNQKKSFGSSWKYVPYVECSLPNRAGQTQACIDAGINGYPTWVFADGTRYEGEITLEALSARTSCPLPQ